MKQSNADIRNRFFIQYYGSKVLYVGGHGLQVVGKGGWNLAHPDFFLQLKHLSEITNKDREEIARIENFDETSENAVSELLIGIADGRCNKYSVIDFLRSRGYAVPFMEYSVEDLVSFGWIKFVQH